MFYLTNEETQIFKMLQGRLFTPIEDITREIYVGDSKRAGKEIKCLIGCKMLEQESNKRITYTTKGKMELLKRSNNSIFERSFIEVV
jgi:hypothetical protein